MGTYLFAGQILTWLPPLVFTAMNEAGVSQRIGIGVMTVWFFIGILCLFLIGDYRKAVAMVGREHMLLEQQDSTLREESAVEVVGDHSKRQADDADAESQ